MKKIFLCMLLAALITACFTVPPVRKEVAAPPCEPVILQVRDVVLNGQLFVFVDGDLDCDGACDKVAVLRYLGKDANGQPEFELLEMMGCAEAEATLGALREKAKAMGASL